MQIKALLPASLIEYPGHIADVLYVGACNFRCPYCYNVDLVLHPESLPDLEPAQVLSKLATRRGFIDGLVFTGGEPTLQPDLPAFLTHARQLGLKVKLDTNGYRPEVLKECLERQLLDYVAMDIKSSLAKYELAVGVPIDPARLLQSIELILHCQVDYEFRTTVVPGLVELQDVEAIVALIAGAKRYYLQCFRPGRTVGWPNGAPISSPSPKLLQSMVEAAAQKIEEVNIRGLPQQAEPFHPQILLDAL